MHRVDIFLIGRDLALILALRDISHHGWVLRLRGSELVMNQVPERFTLSFSCCGHYSLGQLTPGALADDATHLLQV